MPKLLKIFIIALIIFGLISLLSRYFPDTSSADDKYNILYYILLISLVGSGVIVRFKRNMSGGVKQALIWVGAFLVLVLLYSFRNDFIMVKERLVAELMPSMANVTSNGEIEFRASSDGHFRINASVNGTPVRFMLDTGASDVVIPPHIAERIGIDMESLNYNQVYNTANGQGYGAKITIRTLQIGDFRFHDIPASVNKADMDTPLLGMSFLEKLSGYEVENDVLVLRP